MPAISYDGALTTGHGSYPPTKIESSQTKLYIAGKAVLVNGDKATNHGHSNVGICIASQTKVYVAGKAVIMVGDKLSDGDTVAQGNEKFLIR